MIGPAHFVYLVAALLTPAYVWERVSERYGWAREPVYVLNLGVFEDRLHGT